MRTIPMPDWVKTIIDVWLKDAGLTSGRVFGRVNRAGRVWGESMTEKVVWHVVREFAAKAAIEKSAPHDLRRTCARLCHLAGGELEQIQFLLGHVSIQTTERYLSLHERRLRRSTWQICEKSSAARRPAMRAAADTGHRAEQLHRVARTRSAQTKWSPRR